MTGIMTENQPLARMFLTDSSVLLEQSMAKIANCLDQISTDQLWWRPHESGNSIGNLLAHVCGNLRQWTLSGVGGQPDNRDREMEFEISGGHSPAEMLKHVEDETRPCIAFLSTLESGHLTASYKIQDFEVSGLQAVNHTVTHYVGHTHQVIYITRWLLGDRYRFAWTPDSDRGQLPI